MAEGLSPEQSQQADRFYARNIDKARAVEHAKGLIAETEAKEAAIEAAGGINKVDMATIGNYSAGQLLARQRMLQQDKDDRDVNLWRAQEHYQQNKDAYQEQAVQDAAAAGKPTNFGSQPLSS